MLIRRQKQGAHWLWVLGVALPTVAGSQTRLETLPSVSSAVRAPVASEPSPSASGPAGHTGVRVEGQVPDAATRVAIDTPLLDQFGAAGVHGQWRLGGVSASAAWGPLLGRVLSVLVADVRHGQLRAHAQVLELEGEVRDEAQRQQVLARLGDILGTGFTLRHALRVVPAVLAQSQVDQAVAQRSLPFDPGSARLQPDGLLVLRDMAALMTQWPQHRFELIGHTDAVGAPAVNQALSLARAQAVKTQLVALGVAADRLTPLGMGADQPVASNETALGRAQNRRMVFRLVP